MGGLAWATEGINPRVVAACGWGLTDVMYQNETRRSPGSLSAWSWTWQVTQRVPGREGEDTDVQGPTQTVE